MKRKKVLESSIVYIIIFEICTILLLAKWYGRGSTSFGAWDSITQHYPAMLYISRWIREIISNFIRGEFVIPMVDLHIGMGDDIISTLNYYGLGDPFYILSALVNEEYMPYFYAIFFYLRIMLGGCAFIIFVHEMNEHKKVYSYVVGALVYSFSGFALAANYHIIFVHAMMYIPLLMWGAERIISKGKHKVFILTVFLFSLSGFFYLYIGSVSLVFFYVYRMLRTKKSLRDCIVCIRDSIAFYVIGLMLGSFIFVPVIISFLTSNRASADIQLEWFYSFEWIKSFFLNAFMPEYYQNAQVFAVSSIGILSVICILCAKKRLKEKCIILLSIVAMCMPIFSWIMSGFGGIYDRWQIVIILYVAYLTVDIWEELFDLELVQRLGCLFLFAIMSIIGKKMDILDAQYFWITIRSLGILTGFVVFIFPIVKRIKFKKEFIKKGTAFVFFCITVFTICRGWWEVARFREIEYVKHRNVVQELVGDMEETCRIDNERVFGENRNAQNIAMLQEYYGIAEYFSIENTSYADGLKEWNVSPHATLNVINVGVDLRAALETVCGVKYLILDEKKEVSIVPYGFNKIMTTKDEQWSLYENAYALPLVYTYEKIFDEKRYANMHGAQKQDVMLQAIALEDYCGDGQITQEIENNIIEIPYKIIELQNIQIEDEQFLITNGSVMVLEIEIYPECENYVLFQNVDLEQSISILVDNGISKGLLPQAGTHNGNLMANIGTVTEKQSAQIRIEFNENKKLNQSSVKFLAYQYDNYETYVTKLKSDNVEDLIVDNNSISARISLDKDKVLCLAVPYSKGWTAKVDGKKTDIYKANDMFMAIELSAGEHTIEFSYCTLGLRIGIVFSMLGVLLMIKRSFLCK